MQDDFGGTTVRPAGSPLQELARRAAGGAGQQHRDHMNVLIDNLTASPRLPLDSIAWMGGQSEPTMSSTTTGSAGASGDLLFVLALVIPSPDRWSVIQSWISRPMAKIPAGIGQVSVQPSVLLPSPTRSST
jgi:hypothetical protein